MAGYFDDNDGSNLFDYPSSLDVDDDGTMFITDELRHRIIRWKSNTTQGEIIAGGNGKGNQTDLTS